MDLNLIRSVKSTDNLDIRDLLNNPFVRDILDAIHEGIAIMDNQGTILYANQSYQRILGVKTEKVIGKDLFKIAPEAVALQVLSTGREITHQPTRVIKLGKNAVVNSTPIYHNGSLVGVISVFEDITEVKKLMDIIMEMQEYNRYLQEKLKDRDFPLEFKEIVGSSEKLKYALAKASKAARSDVTVLISGETGVGKELVANAIHSASKRREKAFIKVNCAAIPETLLESELFGYEEGAFTGARRGGKPGKFELAHNGTLFLDEIGDMNLFAQAKLLRAIQEKEIERLGGIKTIKVDVRIIVATNQNLEQKIRQKKFREDLFYRLNVFNIWIPPLRERKEDIPLLINYFMNVFAKREQKSALLKLDYQVFEKLLSYNWPGNIRELRNTIEHAVISCQDELVKLSDLPEYLLTIAKSRNNSEKAQGPFNLDTLISDMEIKTILEVLSLVSNNKSKAIQMLGISRSTFYQKLNKYGIK